LRYEPADWFRIPASCFFPPPEVDSACVVMSKRAEPLLSIPEAETFRRLVKRGFSQRRKMMMKLLKVEWPATRLAAGFEQLKLSPALRAEAVTLEQFVELTKILSKTA
jgi:16S rRNA (adenine1518-N6/adenine1519-N6)-dimethyltransferase